MKFLFIYYIFIFTVYISKHPENFNKHKANLKFKETPLPPLLQDCNKQSAGHFCPLSIISIVKKNLICPSNKAHFFQTLLIKNAVFL